MIHFLLSNAQLTSPLVGSNRISRAGVQASIGRSIDTWRLLGARRSPSAKFHLSWPVSGLVNIRIWPSHAIDAHSGFVRFLTSLND